MKDVLRYDRMVEQALRGVVRQSLARTASQGLPGAHHFYIKFQTGFAGVVLPDHLVGKFPSEMTIVLEHQFWDLEVSEDAFSVTLSFGSKPERLTVPFEAITEFADPSVKFGLQFRAPGLEASGAPGEESAKSPVPAKPDVKTGEVVTLDSFRKK